MPSSVMRAMRRPQAACRRPARPRARPTASKTKKRSGIEIELDRLAGIENRARHAPAPPSAAPAKSTWTKLSEPVISVIATFARTGTAASRRAVQRQMMRAESRSCRSPSASRRARARHRQRHAAVAARNHAPLLLEPDGVERRIGKDLARVTQIGRVADRRRRSGRTG